MASKRLLVMMLRGTLATSVEQDLRRVPELRNIFMYGFSDVQANSRALRKSRAMHAKPPRNEGIMRAIQRLSKPRGLTKKVSSADG